MSYYPGSGGRLRAMYARRIRVCWPHVDLLACCVAPLVVCSAEVCLSVWPMLALCVFVASAFLSDHEAQALIGDWAVAGDASGYGLAEPGISLGTGGSAQMHSATEHEQHLGA